MDIKASIKEHFDDKYYRAKHFGARYILDWTLCSLIRKFGISRRCVDPNEVDFRHVKRRYAKLACQIKYDAEYEEGDTIWMMWWQGADVEKPSLVETCIESIKKNRGEYRVAVVDQYNYKEYIDIPQLILDKFNRGVIGIAAFSDYIRFALLEKYGGWYLDATIYVTRPIEQPENSFYSIKSGDFTDHISKAMWSAYLWYLPQGHPLSVFVHQAFDDYWTHHDKMVNYFLIDCIVRTFYDGAPEFKVQVDSLNCDNPDHFFLQREGCEVSYDEKTWNYLCGMNHFFKCDRKKAMWKCNSFASKLFESK